MSKVFEIVTQKIMEQLTQGIVPWRKPWKGGRGPCNISGREYNGINFFYLSLMPFETPVYLTLNQIKEMGGTIKESERKNHFPVFYWSFKVYTEDRNGSKLDKPRRSFIFRYTTVWNIEQVDGIKLPKKFTEKLEPVDMLATAEATIAGYKDGPAIKVKKGGDRACYSPVTDIVTTPHRDQFNSPEEYYSVMFHELGHSTGHAKRLNRKEINDPIIFGSHDYSVEELVAEMTAAFLCAHCAVDNTLTLSNSAAYIGGWMRKLKEDPAILTVAAGRAQKAASYILGKLEEKSEPNDAELAQAA